MAARHRKKKKKRSRRSPIQRLFRGLYSTLVVISAIIVGLWLGDRKSVV